MSVYSKNSPEYLDNGHYHINGEEFMSVWTFKKNFNPPSANATSINGAEGKELAQICSEIYSSKPERGSFSEILIFPLTELKKYYGI